MSLFGSSGVRRAVTIHALAGATRCANVGDSPR